MKTNKLIWILRVLAMVFIVFLSLYALDVFSGEAPLIKKLGGFFVHLIPSFILVIILVISLEKTGHRRIAIHAFQYCTHVGFQDTKACFYFFNLHIAGGSG